MRRYPLRGGAVVESDTEFEEREAARFVGLGWLAYLDLPMEERAATVAFRRMSLRMQAVLEDRRSRG